MYICRVAHCMRGPTAHRAASLGYLFIYIHVYIVIYEYMVHVARSVGGLTACCFVQLLRVFIYIYICIYTRIHVHVCIIMYTYVYVYMYRHYMFICIY